jgi:phage terminase large subunit
MRTVVNLDIAKIIQPSFWNMANSRARYLVAYGGAGAGKSYAAAQKVIAKALKYPNRKIICVRKYGPALRLTCYDIVTKLLRAYQIPHKANRTDMIIELGTDSQILFVPIVNSSGEPAERLKSLTDITDFWLEEPTELSYDEFKMIRLRLRGEELKEGYRQIIMTFNPIDRNHWLHKYFFEPDKEKGQLREADRLRYTYKDNKFLDAEFIKELEALKGEDAVAYQVYALGEWGVLAGQIYNNYVIEEFEHPIDYYDDIVCGVDFGFENPSTMILIGVKENTLYIMDEIYKRKLVNTELIKEIKQKVHMYSLPTSTELFADTAEPARIEEMKRAGLNVKEANKNVIEGINVTKKYRQIIHPRCVEYIKETAGYKRKKDRNGNVLEAPLKFNDHLMDALRYACMGLQRQPGFRVLRGLGKVEL